MDKVLKHLKNNAIIYLILIVCIIVILIALFYKPKEELRETDTSLFEVVNVGQVVHLFDDNSTKFLMVGTNIDQTTANYADYVKYSMLKHEYTPYFLYQEDIDFKKDNHHVVTVNRNPEQYSCTDIHEDEKQLNMLRQSTKACALCGVKSSAIHLPISMLFMKTSAEISEDML